MLYKGRKTKSISFPLGGIGTGSVGLLGNGALGDFEIFGRPNKNTGFGYTFFSVRAENKSGSDTRVLQGDTNESLMGNHSAAGWRGFGFGPAFDSMAGFPHFRELTFDATFPIARLTLREDGFPAVMTLTAFNPLIPNDEESSSIPAAFFEWEIENTSELETDFEIVFTLQNPSALSENRAFSCEGCTGITFFDAGHGRDEIGYSDLTVLTDCERSFAQEYWYRGEWRDGVSSFWRELSSGEGLRERSYTEAGGRDTGSLSAKVSVPAGARRSVRFILSWNSPNAYNYWSPCKDADGDDVTWKNYYATVYESSRESARYAIANFDELYRRTALFTESIESSTLPDFAKDAVSANLSVLKTATVLRLEDGSLWAWEGLQETAGSCDGSCQHVWNYAYAMPYLFPRLERSLRETTLEWGLFPDGATTFRIPLPRGREFKPFRPCLDGQMGEVIKCFREWRLSGDNGWLLKYKDKIFSMLEYAWSEENPDAWDRDCDGVLEGRQHHTLDMELFGPSSWLEGMYLLALSCGADMAEAVGDGTRAKKYRALYEHGVKWTNENLFKNGYFYHKIDLTDRSLTERFGADSYWNDERGEIKYQIADGCFIDQVLSDWHAALIGKAGIFDKDKKLSALRQLYKNNYYPSMRALTNMWRNFALNDESAAIMCTYPEGTYKPVIPVPYCEEAMTGFEYALGGLMLAEGMKDEGEEIIRSIRERYDGERRNPWNEMECGSNYARSMASFALMPIYAGLRFDMTRGELGFSPLGGEGRFFFSVGGSWGEADITEETLTLEIHGDPISLSALSLPEGKRAHSLTVDGKDVPFSADGALAAFAETRVSQKLTVAFA
ncbi:MAG: hypothetical protein IJW48_03640 [Clostridia bacterium]|nr:hypothetical protein [Clostridia bacterium]